MSKSPRGVGFPVYSSFALVLGILLYTYKTSMESARTLDFDLRSVDAAYMLVQKMQELTGALRNAEAANNTYVLLGKDRLLEGYRHNVSELRTQIQALSGTSFAGDTERLRELVENKIVDMDAAIQERDARGVNYAVQIYLTGRWQSLGSSIQAEIVSLQERQRAILEERLGTKQKSIQKTERSIVITSLTGLLLFALAALVITLEIRRRLAYELELERASEFKSQFLANMSHEIRTPMNGVLGMATVLVESKMEARQDHYARVIKRSAESLLRIVNDILDMSKVEAGKIEIINENFDLKSLFADLEALFSNMATKKGLQLHIEIDERAPTYVLGDAGRLRQILNNLIGNALKFTERGVVSVRVVFCSSHDNTTTLRFEVQDTGIGIAEEEQAKVFVAFEQATSPTKTRQSGTGLGLNISKRLVEIMGGSMQMKSRLGEGSTFSFELTLQHHASAPPSVNLVDGRHGEGTPFRRVLVAEDDPTSRELICNLLEGMGIQTDVASDGRGAVRRAQERSYDMLLFDLNMPHLDGIGALKAIRAFTGNTNSRIPAFLVTANMNLSLDGELKDIRLNGVIPKPLQADIFRQRVEGGFSAVPEPDVAEGSELSILVADDSEDNRELLKVFLMSLGAAKVDYVEDGQRAVERFEMGKYDIVLMDIKMPGMCGLQATGKIRDFEKAQSRLPTPILALTGGVSQQEVDECYAAGCSGFCAKPIMQEKLISAVEQLISNKGVGNAPQKAA